MSQSLGSLSQSARSKTLSGARSTLIFIGVLAAIVGAAQWQLGGAMVREAIAEEVKVAERQGMAIDFEEVAKIEAEQIQTARLASGALLGLGVVFIFLGTMVYKIPVIATVTGLVLYVGLQTVSGVLSPETIGKGLLIKIIVVVCLAKAVQAAVAYQKERAAH